MIVDREQVVGDASAQHARLVELHINRAYLSSTMVRGRGEELTIFYKAWPVANTTGGYTKAAFRIDFATTS